MFNNLKLSALTLLAAALAMGNPIVGRQDACDGVALVQCQFSATASRSPDTSAVDLPTEWNIIAGRIYAPSVPPSAPICVGNSTVAGPGFLDLTYLVHTFAGSPDLSSEATAEIFKAGLGGKTVQGPATGVQWAVGGQVTCFV